MYKNEHHQNHHHTVQVARVQVWYLRQWVKENTTGTSCNRWNHHVCKWSICANSWGRNTTTISCCWWQPPQAQGAKVRISSSTSQSRMQQQHATPTTTTTELLRISTCTGGVHNAAIIATFIRAHNSNSFNALPLCKLQWLLHHALHQCADPEQFGGGGGWSCMLLLHPALTCAAADPDLCTLCLWWLSPAATYGGGVSPSAIGTYVYSTCTCGSFTYCNLRWCFSFTHWYRYQACTQATTYIFIYCMAGNFDGNLFWWISGFVSNPPIFRLPKLYSVMSSLLHNHSFRV